MPLRLTCSSEEKVVVKNASTDNVPSLPSLFGELGEETAPNNAARAYQKRGTKHTKGNVTTMQTKRTDSSILLQATKQFLRITSASEVCPARKKDVKI